MRVSSIAKSPDPDQIIFVFLRVGRQFPRIKSLGLKQPDLAPLEAPALAKHNDKRYVKGADLRRAATRKGRNQRRQATGFLELLMAMLAHHDVKLLARVWFKGLAQPFDGRSVYTSSIQGLYTYFESYLSTQDDLGVCIADRRDPWKNANVAHSIFTQKFRAS